MNLLKKRRLFMWPTVDPVLLTKKENLPYDSGDLVSLGNRFFLIVKINVYVKNVGDADLLVIEDGEITRKKARPDEVRAVIYGWANLIEKDAISKHDFPKKERRCRSGSSLLRML